MKIVISVLIILINVNIFAAEFGRSGTTYKIVEIDMLEAVENKASQVDWEQIFRKEAERVKKEAGIVDFPLKRAEKNTTRYVNLTTQIDHDIFYKDPKTGLTKVLYPKGFKYNVLAYIKSIDKFVVLNGEREEEISWYMKEFSSDLNVYPLVAKGNVIELTEKTGGKILFTKLTEQLIEKFSLTSTPTVFYQEGHLMRIDEVSLNMENLE